MKGLAGGVAGKAVIGALFGPIGVNAGAILGRIVCGAGGAVAQD